MAEILPFRALHYDPQLVHGIARVVTEPYDKITPDLQARYYESSPYNLARIIRRRPDSREPDPYAAAAHDFRDWVERGILETDDTPAIYPYHQEYVVTGLGQARTRRRGFIALCRLEEYSAGVVYRHEETLSGPRADRLALLRTTRAHFGQIFMLYSDPEGLVEGELAEATDSAPWESADDESGVRHEVWRLTGAEAVKRIETVMRSKKLVIADGHHRYETALAYRAELRREGRRDSAADYVMATFVRIETEGLLILPTHRVVHGLEYFDWTRFLASAKTLFEGRELAALAPGTSASWREELSRVQHQVPRFLAYGGGGRAALLSLREDAARSVLAGLPEGLRRLDVVALHRCLLDQVLGIRSEAVREEKNLRYERDAEAATKAVDEGRADVCFLMNPTPIEAVWSNALAGQVMPQKSTDFYPKLLSGLTIYDLDGGL